MGRIPKSLIAAALLGLHGIGGASYRIDTQYSVKSRTGKGRKRTTTAAQQKRDKIKRKNKGK